MLTPKAIFPLFLFCLLVIQAPTAQSQSGATWEPYNELGDFYPSFAIAVTNLPDSAFDGKDETNIGDPNGIIGILFTPDRNNTRISIQLSCASEPKLFSPATLDVTLPEADEDYRITPNVLFDLLKLASIKQPITASITYMITINGKKQPPRTEPLRVHSVNDCPLVVTDDDDDTTMSWTLAAYVNEDHPAVEQVLQESLRKKYVGSFVGYQGDDTSVYQQVLAVWRVLQDRGSHYMNTDNATGGRDVPIQPVQLLDESTRTPQLTCVDGSVLIASLLRKIGLNPILMAIPGHFFVGFDLDASGEKQVYLETTLMGVAPAYAASTEKQLADQLTAGVTDQKAQSVINSFVAAIESGNRTYAQNKSRIMEERTGYVAVAIDDARQAGILPIRTR